MQQYYSDYTTAFTTKKLESKIEKTRNRNEQTARQQYSENRLNHRHEQIKTRTQIQAMTGLKDLSEQQLQLE